MLSLCLGRYDSMALGTNLMSQKGNSMGLCLRETLHEEYRCCCRKSYHCQDAKARSGHRMKPTGAEGMNSVSRGYELGHVVIHCCKSDPHVFCSRFRKQTTQAKGCDCEISCSSES